MLINARTTAALFLENQCLQRRGKNTDATLSIVRQTIIHGIVVNVTLPMK
jgi:hypothetical protein